MIDLHTHSAASDGTLMSPGGPQVGLAADKGLSAIASNQGFRKKPSIAFTSPVIVSFSSVGRTETFTS